MIQFSIFSDIHYSVGIQIISFENENDCSISTCTRQFYSILNICIPE